MSHYDTLGVPPDADPTAIKRAFRRAAKHAHPDREGGSDDKMAKINDAYAVLADPARRAHYDATGADAPTESPMQQAESLVMQAMQAMLARPGNLAKNTHDALQAQHAQMLQAGASITNQISALERRRAQISKKGGDAKNLAHMVIDQQLAQMAQQLAQCTAKADLLRDAIALAKEYRDTEPTRTEFGTSTFFRGTTGSY